MIPMTTNVIKREKDHANDEKGEERGLEIMPVTKKMRERDRKIMPMTKKMRKRESRQSPHIGRGPTHSYKATTH